MTKKDYIKIAEILKWWGNLTHNEQIGRFWKLEEKFIEMFKQDNPNFDQVRFKKAINE